MSKNDSKDDCTGRMATALVSRPYIALCIVLAIAAFLCSGLHKFELEKNIENLWIEDGSIVGKEMTYERDHKYKTLNSDTQLATTITLNDPNNNVMTRNILDKHLKMAERVRDITFDHNGHTYKYEDVCASVSKYRVQCQRVTVLDCFKEGAFDFPAYNAIYVLDSVLGVVAGNVANVVLLTAGTSGFVAQVETGMIAQVKPE